MHAVAPPLHLKVGRLDSSAPRATKLAKRAAASAAETARQLHFTESEAAARLAVAKRRRRCGHFPEEELPRMQIQTPRLAVIPEADGREEGVALAIERYVAATSLVLIRVLGDCCRSFAEPRSGPPASSRSLGYLVETLRGVATGAVLGQVLGILLRSFDGEVGERLSRSLRDAISHLAFPRAVQSGTSIRPVLLVLDQVPRPLVDELWVQLHGRLAAARAVHRDLLTQMAAAIPAERTCELSSILGRLQRHTLLASVWSRHLELAWRFYSLAARGGTSAEPALPPELVAGTAAETWRAWLRRVRGEKERDAPKREAIAVVV
jgi:hypothetical protein